jgi:hypothetical protein
MVEEEEKKEEEEKGEEKVVEEEGKNGYYLGVHKNYLIGGAAAVGMFVAFPYVAPVGLYYAGFTSTGMLTVNRFHIFNVIRRNCCQFICCCITSCRWKCCCGKLDCHRHFLGNDRSYVYSCLCYCCCSYWDSGNWNNERSFTFEEIER